MEASFFQRPAYIVAPELIGCFFGFGEGDDLAGGIIVEAEAYGPDDPASHSFRGPTLRNQAMFGEPGTAYVYRSYGIHWCFNITCLPGSAVLLRALEPTAGLDLMRTRRGVEPERLLCSGPGKLCQALGIDLALNGRAIDQPPFTLRHQTPAGSIVSGPRVGISKAVDQPWRFGLANSRFLSKRF